MAKRRVYFDYAATTPVAREVFEAMKPYFFDIFGNASSIHSFGQQALFAIDESRETLAKLLNCKPREIFFTSGATESDNLAIFGIVKPGDHIITSNIEHPAVLEPCQQAVKRGLEVSFIQIDKKGLLSVDSITKSIKPNTRLISIMYVNNEIGTIQPIAAIGQLIKSVNTQRIKQRLPEIYFHTDAAQAVNYCSLDVQDLGVDLLSLSGHKIYGPKGVGVLYRRTGVDLKPIHFGGHQESGLRPGTLNVAAIVGLAKAAELLLDQARVDKENKKIKSLRDRLISELPKKIERMQVNGDLRKRVINNANFSFHGVEGESMILLLDQEGIAVSTGSACSSGSLSPSHVLMALVDDPILAHGSLRITLGRYNTETDVGRLINVLPSIVQKLRKISPIKF